MLSSRRSQTVFCLFGVLVLTAPMAACVERWQYSRELHCENQTDNRARQICRSVERHLEYTCCGHAIISPGYRSTWTTVKAVWCEERIEEKDVAALRALAKANDWRLVSAAESLLRLLTGRDQYGTEEPETSIFHPANPEYLLKDGCREKP
jgi:hypothetical protein